MNNELGVLSSVESASENTTALSPSALCYSNEVHVPVASSASDINLEPVFQSYLRIGTNR